MPFQVPFLKDYFKWYFIDRKLRNCYNKKQNELKLTRPLHVFTTYIDIRWTETLRHLIFVPRPLYKVHSKDYGKCGQLEGQGGEPRYAFSRH